MAYVILGDVVDVRRRRNALAPKIQSHETALAQYEQGCRETRDAAESEGRSVRDCHCCGPTVMIQRMKDKIAEDKRRLAYLDSQIAQEEKRRQDFKRFQQLRLWIMLLLCFFVPMNKWEKLFRHLRRNPPGVRCVIVCFLQPEELDPQLEAFLSLLSDEAKKALLSLDPSPPMACAVMEVME